VHPRRCSEGGERVEEVGETKDETRENEAKPGVAHDTVTQPKTTKMMKLVPKI
jgi:hypothetical protein